jgi:zinc transporter ZupT
LAFLIAALAATAAGPLLYRVLHERPGLARHVDAFVYIAVPALVAWQILPAAWERRSVLPLVAVAAGLLLPMWMGRASQPLRHGTDTLTLLVVLSGLLLHTLFEGAALAPVAAGQSAVAFGTAIVLHRVVEGLVVWWFLAPSRGASVALLGVSALLLLTTLGFVLGRELLGAADGTTATIYQALVAGSLLHVIFHQGRHVHAHDRAHS